MEEETKAVDRRMEFELIELLNIREALNHAINFSYARDIEKFNALKKRVNQAIKGE